MKRVHGLAGFLIVLIAAAAMQGCTSTEPDAPQTCERCTAFLGDSITYRWQPLPIVGALNLGVSGETSEQISERMPELLNSGAATVVILAGTNDILKTPVADIDYVQSMALQARDAGLRVILATIPPTGEGEGDSMARVQAFNAALTEWATAENFPLVDYYGSLAADYPADTVDGIHPNEQGYALMWAALSPNFQ